MRAAIVPAASIVLLLGACAPLPPRTAERPLRSQAPLDAPASAGEKAAWPEARWWRHYGDATLDALIDQGLENAPSLHVAGARFSAARAAVREAGANVGARVDLQAQYQRQRLSDNGMIPPQFLGFNWYNQADLGLAASYTFDWWGKQRSVVESAVDMARASQAEREAAHLTLAALIADTYFGWQLDQARLALANRRAEDAQRAQGIASSRVAAEIDPPDVLHAATAAAAAAREQVAGLEGSARLRVVALAALAGKAPSELPSLSARALPEVSAALPDDVGIDLLARRPDIVASRWRVEAARRSVDSARADYYPDVSLHALLGVESLKLGKLLRAGSGVPSLGAALHLPLFDSGRIAARLGATRAQLQSAIADYDDSIVGAAKDVATQLALRDQLLRQRAEAATQSVAAENALRLAQARVAAGTVDLRPQLQAEQQSLSQQDAALQLQGAALSADIGLRRALGGGYEPDPALRGGSARLNDSPKKTQP
ncbi:MAG: efflux transporter outer membrane subunit [Proteobacteria bacterium]|nr:efflux transporter outer membrane subunit [Pseudomonadota bacterium]